MQRVYARIPAAALAFELDRLCCCLKNVTLFRDLGTNWDLGRDGGASRRVTVHDEIAPQHKLWPDAGDANTLVAAGRAICFSADSIVPSQRDLYKAKLAGEQVLHCGV